LIQAEADVNAKGGDFSTPYQAAAANSHQMILLFLLDRGAEVNRKGGSMDGASRASLKWVATRRQDIQNNL
jgi:hypothetical protein